MSRASIARGSMPRPGRVAAVALCAVLASAGSTPAAAQTVHFTGPDGSVSIRAHDVTLAAVLEAWASAGGATVVNARRVADERVTFDADAMAEAEALDALLHGVAGYVLVAKQPGGRGASRFQELRILDSWSPRTNETVSHAAGTRRELAHIAPVLTKSARTELAKVPPVLLPVPASRQERHAVPLTPVPIGECSSDAGCPPGR